MENKKEHMIIKKTWIQYGIFALVAIILYATGMHTEVIGFAQRGLLATGLMNPDIEEISSSKNGMAMVQVPTKADLNLNLMDKEGNLITLKELKGKVIFMNFWATWCPPCLAEMPSIDKLHDEMGKEVTFVMISLDNDFEKAKAFNIRKDYDLPIYAPASNLPEMYRSSALPTTYIIGADGNLALVHKGMADYSDPDFKEFLNSLK